MGQAGNIDAVVIRFAHNDCCPSRRVSSTKYILLILAPKRQSEHTSYHFCAKNRFGIGKTNSA
jgi:hypothetical protein